MKEKIFSETSQKIRIKWKFELTVFELTVPDLYDEGMEQVALWISSIIY